MLSDSAEETQTLTMDDHKYQLPSTLLPASTPTPPTTQPLFSLSLNLNKLPPSPPPWGEAVDFSEFYHNNYDNSFPQTGFLSNEQRVSNFSPTANTSFLSETSFNAQSLLKNEQGSGLPSDHFGLLTANCSPIRRNDCNGQDFAGNIPSGGSIPRGGDSLTTSSPPTDFLGGDREPVLSRDKNSSNAGSGMNDSGLSSMGASSHPWNYSPNTTLTTPPRNNNQFEFSFPTGDNPTIIIGDGSSGGSSNGNNNGNNASADSPPRNNSQEEQDNLSNQWNSVDVSTLLENIFLESSGSNSEIATSGLGSSIWSPSQGSVPSNFNFSNNNPFNGSNTSGCVNEPQWETTLARLTKQQLLTFDKLLLQTHQECTQNGDTASADRIQALLIHVQQYIIKSFVPESGSVNDSNGSPPGSGEYSPPPLFPFPPEQSLDRMVELHRDLAGSRDAPYTWSGQLPPRIHHHPVTYSCKVFLGGLPFDVTEQTLVQSLKPFGNVKIEWPGKEMFGDKIKGFAYAILENERHVKHLLQNCLQDFSSSSSGNYYYQISSRRYRNKNVQVIPWAMSDSNFVRCHASKIDPLKTIFVGALHGMVNAEGLATIMNDLFGGVVYAGIDTDKTKYPIGSARVTFNNDRSYMRAVTACYVYIKTGRFKKKVQVDPYLEDATCSVCKLQQGPYFCRNKTCFNYYCRTCFHQKHAEGSYRNHQPMMRTASNKVGLQRGGAHVTKFHSHSAMDQHFRFGYQNHRNHNSNNNMMKDTNGGHHYHHYSGNGYGSVAGDSDNNNGHNSFYNNPNSHRNAWHNNGHQRYQSWSNGGTGHEQRRGSSPLDLMNNYQLTNASQQASSMFVDVFNQGSTDPGSGNNGFHQQYATYNNHRKFGNRQQQQQGMRIQ